MAECPACGSDNYEYYSGACDSHQQLEPDTGFCPDCGFQYSQHCDHPESEQVERYRAVLAGLPKDGRQ